MFNITSIRAMLAGEPPHQIQGYWMCCCVIAGRVVRNPAWLTQCDTCKEKRP